MPHILGDNFLTQFENEAQTYNFDFTNKPQIKTGQTISSVTSITSDPSGLTFGSSSISSDGKKVQVRISGGTANTAYDIECRAVTSGGDTVVICGRLTILECS